MSAASLDQLSLSTQQKILLATDGTVTDLVRFFTGEEIQVTKLSQAIINTNQPDFLSLSQPTDLLHRRILLSGSKHYLYAESYFVIERMSATLRQALLDSDVPIGLLWQQEKLETFREILSQRCELDESLSQYFSDVNELQFLTRSYRVYHNSLPLGLITEKFPISYFC